MVSEEHVTLLAVASFMSDWKKQEIKNDDIPGIVDLAQRLWNENNKSVNYRYGERKRTPKINPKTKEYYKNLFELYDYFSILKLSSSYDYQTCEHPGYIKSYAYKVIQKLDANVSYHIIKNLKQYENAPWTI